MNLSQMYQSLNIYTKLLIVTQLILGLLNFFATIYFIFYFLRYFLNSLKLHTMYFIIFPLLLQNPLTFF